MKAIRSFFNRWQEFVIWLPLLVFLAVGGWVVLGALDRTVGADFLAQLLQLPITAAYLATACAAAWLFKRTYLLDLSSVEERAMHESAGAGNRMALRLIILDRLEWLVLIGLFVAFFWISR